MEGSSRRVSGLASGAGRILQRYRFSVPDGSCAAGERVANPKAGKLMLQTAFPFFPEGVTQITALLAFCKQDGQITYFNGAMPVFVHEADDPDSFRMITAQFCGRSVGDPELGF
jgi:hypothetical protein